MGEAAAGCASRCNLLPATDVFINYRKPTDNRNKWKSSRQCAPMMRRPSAQIPLMPVMSCMPPSMCSAIAPVSAVRLQWCATRASVGQAGRCSGQKQRAHSNVAEITQHQLSTSSAPAQPHMRTMSATGCTKILPSPISPAGRRQRGLSDWRQLRLKTKPSHSSTPTLTHPPVCAELAMMRTTVSTWPLHARMEGGRQAGRQDGPGWTRSSLQGLNTH